MGWNGVLRQYDQLCLSVFVPLVLDGNMELGGRMIVPVESRF